MVGKVKWGCGWWSWSARGCFTQIGSRSHCTCERRIQGDSSVKHWTVGTNFSRELQYTIMNAYLVSPTETKHSWAGKGQNFFYICPEEKSLGLNTLLHKRTEKQVNKISSVTFVSKALVTLFAFLIIIFVNLCITWNFCRKNLDTQILPYLLGKIGLTYSLSLNSKANNLRGEYLMYSLNRWNSYKTT